MIKEQENLHSRKFLFGCFGYKSSHLRTRGTDSTGQCRKARVASES